MDFEEFVAAALHVNQLEEHDSEKWQQRSRAAFEKFDIDRDGFITAEELRMVCISLTLCLLIWVILASTLFYGFYYFVCFAAYWLERVH